MTVVRVGARRLEISREDKVLFPEDGITKGDLVDYYRRIASAMLPYLKGRPVMMQRFPDGIDGPGFYQKDTGTAMPSWIHRVKVKKAGGTVTHVVCDDAATLVYLADQACITPHVWLSRADQITHPDQLIFDLDPSGHDFSIVRTAARDLRALLEELGLPSFVKSTGSRGLHVVIPLLRKAGFDEVRSFARGVAELLVSKDPDHLTVEARKDKRKGRLLIDVMRNSYAQTAVAPYAVRAKPGAPVAVPLTWPEVASSRLTAQRYTVRNVFRLLAQRPDPWAGMFRQARGLNQAARRLEKMSNQRSQGGDR
jgi:bifunctional non-homologous end joining protein LigD